MIDGHIFSFASFRYRAIGGQVICAAPISGGCGGLGRRPDLHYVDCGVQLCEGFAGCCRVCAVYHGSALELQRFWKEKAATLRIPLSEKGHEVSQTTRIRLLDTFRGVFSMLPD